MQINRSSTFLLIGAVLAALMVAACQPISADRGETAAAPAAPAITLTSEEQALVDSTLTQVAQQTGAAPDEITVTSLKAVDWPDSSLGCPQPDFVYAAVVTPGYLITLDAGGETVEVHTSMAANAEVVICTP